MEHDFECFGSLVFDDRVMKATLSAEMYQRLRRTVDDGQNLDAAVADAVAAAMKSWAVEHGATHFTHWFQPLTGITAEKHECFISPASDGRIIPEFSGKELIEGAEQVRDILIPAMLRLREACDAAEPLVDAEQWPIPTYSDLLFGV